MPTDERTLEILLKARCPIIYVVTPDEERLERLLLRIAERLGHQVQFWSVTQGFFDRQGGTTSVSSADSRDPEVALRLLTEEGYEGAVTVMRDFHDHIAVSRTKRRLRDLARQFRGGSRTLVLVAPLLTLPEELRPEVEVLHLAPPDQDEQRRFINRFLRNMDLRLEDVQVERASEALVGLSELQTESVVAKALVVQQQLDVEFLRAERDRLLGLLPAADAETLAGPLIDYEEQIGRLLEAADPATREALAAALLHPPLRARLLERLEDRWPELLATAFKGR